ncbi:unnamed protein product [Mytilus edulis]|uniref:Uncharacterized protein n=1 Tax=Mytilus edulis TaxID=6550 RepID=A0A8S3PY32_MYTED|nr:unnamed protein product [Mytilus edulis]
MGFNQVSSTEKSYLGQDELTRSILPTGTVESSNVTDLMSITEKPYWGSDNSTRSNLTNTSVGSLNATDIMTTTDKSYLRWGSSATMITGKEGTYEDIGSIPADHIYTAMQQSSGRDSYIQPRSPYINHHTNTLIGKIEEHEFTEGESEDNQYSQMKDQHHYVDIIAWRRAKLNQLILYINFLSSKTSVLHYKRL